MPQDPRARRKPPEPQDIDGDPLEGVDLEDESDGVSISRVDRQSESTPHRVQLKIRRRLPGRRLDKYLHGRFRKLSRTTIQKLIKRGEILVNGRPTKNSYEMEGGDIVDITIPAPEPYDVVPENIPLDIVYEDDFILAINKPIDMIAHPASRTQTGTVANAVAYYSNSLSNSGDPFRPGIVHRLDKNTTGIMLIAKTDEAHWRLALQFEQRTTQKVYFAIVHGEPEFDEDIINVPIGQHPTVHDRYVATGFAERMGSKFEKKLSKEAVTHYRVAERFGMFSYVELFPKTGRTHQLRIHMSHIRHPIVGDPFYGGRNISIRDVTNRGTDDPAPHWCRQMLHAQRIRIEHPIKQTPLEIVAPLPDDMNELLALLREYRGKPAKRRK